MGAEGAAWLSMQPQAVNLHQLQLGTRWRFLWVGESEGFSKLLLGGLPLRSSFRQLVCRLSARLLPCVFLYLVHLLVPFLPCLIVGLLGLDC